MNQNPQAGTGNTQSSYEPLFNALRREDSDTRIWELMEALRKKGVSTDDMVARVVKAVGASAGVRAQKIARNRAQLMATGTMQRYKPSRTRRFKRWLRDIQESFGMGPSRRGN